jgi:hypothetical protein
LHAQAAVAASRAAEARLRLDADAALRAHRDEAERTRPVAAAAVAGGMISVAADVGLMQARLALHAMDARGARDGVQLCRAMPRKRAPIVVPTARCKQSAQADRPQQRKGGAAVLGRRCRRTRAVDAAAHTGGCRPLQDELTKARKALAAEAEQKRILVSLSDRRRRRRGSTVRCTVSCVWVYRACVVCA